MFEDERGDVVPRWAIRGQWVLAAFLLAGLEVLVCLGMPKLRVVNRSNPASFAYFPYFLPLIIALPFLIAIGGARESGKETNPLLATTLLLTYVGFTAMFDILSKALDLVLR